MRRRDGRVLPLVTDTVRVGISGRERYLRKAIRRKTYRWASQRQVEVEIETVEASADTHPVWVGRPPPFEFRRGRSRAGDDGYHRPFGIFRLTFSAPLDGPLCLGYGCHYGLGLFLPLRTLDGSEQ